MAHQIEVENKVTEDFLFEAVIMRKFNHPNILSLCGVSVHDNKPCVVLPLMKNGDLKHYVLHNKQVCFSKLLLICILSCLFLTALLAFFQLFGQNLTVANLCGFALDVAKGLDYLEDQNFIHRDVAARNCM